MTKRAADEKQEPSSTSAKKASRKSKKEESSFEQGTTEKEWSASDSDTVYLLRFIHGDTCCESPYSDVEDWPTISFTQRIEEDDEDRNYVLSVIGGVWDKSSGKFVAFWGADEGDGHVDFYCTNDFDRVDDLSPLSGILCTEICPPMIDVFDDGSGKDRDPVLIEANLFDHELLSSLYA